MTQSNAQRRKAAAEKRGEWERNRKNLPKNPFVQFELSEQQQADCKKWQAELFELDEVLQEALQAGYRLTVKYDEFSRSMACWLICPETSEDENAGMILPARGSTGMKAVKQLVVKIKLLAGRKWHNWAKASTENVLDD